MNIRAERNYISHILEWVKSGILAVPEFQRDFVWSTKQVIDLFDSILKGYPIGSLILWRPDHLEFKELREIGGLSIEYSRHADKQYVLDGRQRLTALLSSLYQGGKFYDKLCVDLDDLHVLSVSSLNTNSLNLLSLGMAFDTYELVEYMDRLRQSNLPEERKKQYADKAKLINKILNSYELGYISVLGGTIDDAVEVFSRLNSKSTKISPDYMLQALAYNPDSNFLFANEITRIINDLSPYNFESLDRKLVLKCVYHYLNIPFIDGKENQILQHKKDLQKIMSGVSIDVNKAVEFLFCHCGVIDSRMLPYGYQFVMLALFFKENRQPTKNQLKELVKWFFYTTYYGYFTNTSLSQVRKDIRRFTEFALGKKESPMEYDSYNVEPSWPSKLMLSNVVTCVVAAISILKTGGNQDNATLNVFTLPDMGERTWGNTFFLSDKKDAQDILQYLKNDDAPWEESYACYALSEPLVSLYRDRQLDAFTEQRDELIHNQVESFLKQL